MMLRSLALAFVVACSSNSAEVSPDAPPMALDAPSGPHGAPLVLVLSHLQRTGSETIDYLGIPSDVITLAPNAISGYGLWSASQGCCDPSIADGFGRPDEASVTQLVLDRIGQGDIDPARVYVIGHGSGGFLAWRLLCDRAKIFHAGVILAGGANATNDPTCAPAHPIRVLHVHGTGDGPNKFGYDTGGHFGTMPEAYPSALASLEQEGTAAGCQGTLTSNGPITSGILNMDGSPASVVALSRTCLGAADHWRVDGEAGAYDAPKLSASFYPTIFAWFQAH